MRVSPKKISNWFILTIVGVAVFCSEPNKVKNNEYNELPIYSVDNLKMVLSEVPIESIVDFDSSKVLAPYNLTVTLDNKYWVVADRLENLIILYNRIGSYIAETGGKGRGPGEFEGAKVLHIGWQNKLYVLDMRAQRITQYQLNKNGFTNTSSFSPSSSFEPGSQLLNIYVTEWGNYGVIRRIVDYKKGLEEYLFFELDAEFRPIKKLFAIPGNDKMSLDRWTHIDHLVGQKSFWDFDGEWFYYVNSHSTKVNKYNLKTGVKSTRTHLRLEERKLTEEAKLEFMKMASNITERSDKIHEAFVTTDILPYFQNFTLYNNNYYFVIFNTASSKNTELIRVNETTGEIQYIDLPLSLWKIQAGKQMIYGVDISGEDSQIRVINLKE